MSGASQPVPNLVAATPGGGGTPVAPRPVGRSVNAPAGGRRRPRTPSLPPQLTPPLPSQDEQPIEAALRALPIAGFTRRRIAWVIGAAVTIWVVAVFARQVGEASAAATRADQIRADNAALAAEVDALSREVDVVNQNSFILFQARAFGLGGPKDRPFTLAPDAPPLASDAPGSAALRVGAEIRHQDPLDSWLSLLFGP